MYSIGAFAKVKSLINIPAGIVDAVKKIIARIQSLGFRFRKNTLRKAIAAIIAYISARRSSRTVQPCTSPPPQAAQTPVAVKPLAPLKNERHEGRIYPEVAAKSTYARGLFKLGSTNTIKPLPVPQHKSAKSMNDGLNLPLPEDRIPSSTTLKPTDQPRKTVKVQDVSAAKKDSAVELANVKASENVSTSSVIRNDTIEPEVPKSLFSDEDLELLSQEYGGNTAVDNNRNGGQRVNSSISVPESDPATKHSNSLDSSIDVLVLAEMLGIVCPDHSAEPGNSKNSDSQGATEDIDTLLKDLTGDFLPIRMHLYSNL